MKTRTLLSTAVLAIVALALTVPAVGQTLNWQIPLRGETARNFGTADYVTVKTAAKFSVEATVPSMEDGAKLEVFIGPPTNANEPFGKLVGVIDIDSGSGAMILIGAKAPSIHAGNTVLVVDHSTARGEVVLKGTY